VPENLDPPTAASWLLSSFSDPAVPQILGDLMEEYHERARASEVSIARRWYWREALRNSVVLLWRQHALQAGIAAIAFLVAVHAAMIFAAHYAWQEWATATSQIVNGLPVEPWLAWYGSSWRMAYPPVLGHDLEFYAAIGAGFGFGTIFARVFVERSQLFRISVLCCWAFVAAWFVIHMLSFTNMELLWRGYSIKFPVRPLLSDFSIRESMAAASFWLGTYVGAWRRRESAVLGD
jgi:hypothetical protein